MKLDPRVVIYDGWSFRLTPEAEARALERLKALIKERDEQSDGDNNAEG